MGYAPDYEEKTQHQSVDTAVDHAYPPLQQKSPPTQEELDRMWEAIKDLAQG